MKLFTYLATLILSLVMFNCSKGTNAVNSSNQLIESDSIAFKIILDSNSISETNMREFTTIEDGRIVVLDLDAQFTILPAEIGALTALRNLCISGSNISDLPKEIGNQAN